MNHYVNIMNIYQEDDIPSDEELLLFLIFTVAVVP